MDESWRRRRPAIQPHQVADYLAPHDFRDVFGGPPRSVLLRHFSPSAQHANSGFRIMTREDNSPYNTVTTCKPEFVSTIRCGRNGFRVTKREVETANKTDFYKLGLASATSSRYGDNDGFQVKKKEENLPYGKVSHNLDPVSATCSPHGRSEVMKRECSSIPVVQKRDDLSTVRDDHNDFRVMEREHDSLYNTKSNLYAPTTNYARNGFRVTKSEVDDMFSEDSVVYRPISGQHSMTWSGNNKFQALISEEGFYDDIFGSVSVDSNAGLRRSRSRSISKSESESTAVSCCEDGFLAANAGYGDEGDPALASFASKLRLVLLKNHIILICSTNLNDQIGKETLQ